MYETFFGLHDRPFTAAPLAKRYFSAPAIEAARQTLGRCIERAEGIGLLIGPAGTGKSLLCRVLAEQFRKTMEVALLASGRLCTRRALFQAILFELGLPYRGMEESDLRMMLVDHLSARSGLNQPGGATGLLVIVDEAHTLPLRLLDELRLLTNFSRGDQARVRVVLSGGPALEERFASSKMEALNQRITARCYLESFDRQQTINYVRHQIQQAGGNADLLFAPAAIEAVYQATDGIPRLINQVCDYALLLAFTAGIKQLPPPLVEEAWADLQQLPTPWTSAQGAPAKEAATSVVEFGQLDDELADELPQAVPFRNGTSDQPISQPQPAERLRQITAQLAELDDDFEPVGSIGPEVELVFQSTSNPFQERFDEEEIVIDRYNTIEADALANRPMVRSAESQQLGAMLSAFADAQAPSVAIAATTWPGGVPTAQPSSGQPQTSPAKTAAAAREKSAVAQLQQSQLQPKPQDERPVVTPNVAAASNLDDELDLIVIEELPELTIPRPKKISARVERKEYRQLFAQLRAAK